MLLEFNFSITTHIFAPENFAKKHVSKLVSAFLVTVVLLYKELKLTIKPLTVRVLLIQMQNISLHSGIGLKDLFTLSSKIGKSVNCLPKWLDYG